MEKSWKINVEKEGAPCSRHLTVMSKRHELKTLLFEQSYSWHPCYTAL